MFYAPCHTILMIFLQRMPRYFHFSCRRAMHVTACARDIAVTMPAREARRMAGVDADADAALMRYADATQLMRARAACKCTLPQRDMLMPLLPCDAYVSRFAFATLMMFIALPVFRRLRWPRRLADDFAYGRAPTLPLLQHAAA